MYDELPIIQKTYDFTLWFVPILNRLPRDHKFGLGSRMIQGDFAGRIIEESRPAPASAATRSEDQPGAGVLVGVRADHPPARAARETEVPPPTTNMSLLWSYEGKQHILMQL